MHFEQRFTCSLIRTILSVALLSIATSNFALPQNAQTNRNNTESELRRAGQLRQQAIDLYQKNNLKAAIPLMEQAVSVAGQALGVEHVSMADLQSEVGMLYRENGDYRSARKALEQSLAIRKNSGGLNNSESIKALNDLGTLLGAMGKYAEAKPLFEQAVASAKNALGPEHADTAGSINNLGGLLEEMGDYAGAKRNYEQSLAIARKVFGNENPNTATAINNMSVVLQKLEDFPAALKFSLEGLAIRRKVLGQNSPEVALSLDNLSVLYAEMHQYDKAKSSAEQAVELYKKNLGDDHPETATSIANFGQLMQSLGDTASAKTLLEESLKIRKKVLGPDHPYTASSLDQLAGILDDSGDFVAARPLYEQALAIRRKSLGDDHPTTAESFLHVGRFLESIGDYAAAQNHVERALAINEKIFGSDHTATADALSSLASVSHHRGNLKEAKGYLEKALSIRMKVFGPNDLSVSRVYNNLGMVECENRELEISREHLMKCLAIRKKLLPEDHPDLAVIFNNLGIVSSALRDSKASIEYYEQAVRVSRKCFGDESPKTARSLANLALEYAFSKDRSRSADLFDESRKSNTAYARKFLPAMSQREQLQFLAEKQALDFSTAVSFAIAASDDPSIVKRSAEWVINSKGLAHEVLAKTSVQTRFASDGKQASDRDQLLLIRSQMGALLKDNGMSESTEAKRKLRELAEQEEKLARLLQSQNLTSAAHGWHTLVEVRSKIAGGTSLVEYVKYLPFENQSGGQNIERYAAWIIPSINSGDVRLVDLGNAEAIDETVSKARSMLTPRGKTEIANIDRPEAFAELTKVTRELSKELLDPLELDDNCKELLICPDGDLWLLPWSALAIDSDGSFLVERFSIRYLISGRQLLDSEVNPAKRGASAIFANPKFDLAPASVWQSIRDVLRTKSPNESARIRSAVFTSGKNKFANVQPLPGTATEAELILPNLEKYSRMAPITYAGQYALESVAKALKSPEVVVFATHGYFQGKPLSQNRAQLNVQSRELSSAPLEVNLQPIENPLLNCGLLLAGCSAPDAGVGTAGDDGVLTGLEISGLDLNGTRLVVLSACETGVGEVHNGEGAAGLRQSFQTAGARSVVATLWAVPDRESALLVSTLFANLASGKSASVSLRDAQLDRIAKRRERFGTAHPYYWAAFTLTGF